MAKTTKRKKSNPQDLTLRNLRALKRRLEQAERRLAAVESRVERIVRDLWRRFKGPRTLPAPLPNRALDT